MEFFDNNKKCENIFSIKNTILRIFLLIISI